MAREYIKVPESKPLTFDNINLIKTLDDDFWLDLVFYHILSFYKNYDAKELRDIIAQERKNKPARIENCISKYIRKYLRNNREFDFLLDVNGEAITDTDKEAYYDIKISSTLWKNKNYFPIECKNLSLDSDKNYINKYIYYKMDKTRYDGGVYRYFNKKYAQNQNFGGMLGFILEDDLNTIKKKIIEKLNNPFDTTPDGDLIEKGIKLNSIEANNFTFNSIHKRFNGNFTLYHFLFQVN